MPQRPAQSAFSLVELSIVLVILGLLTGGILGGQSLIRAAELRAISTEYSRYSAAAQTFRDKYFAVPGDMANATAFWGKDATNCNGDTGAPGLPGTCNGNGDGRLLPALAVSSTAEIFQLWKQLALAGLIEGNYSGLAGSLGEAQAIIGENVPRSRMSNTGWTVYPWFVDTGNPEMWAVRGDNALFFGAQTATHVTYNPVLKPEEAWNIDSKMDDGRPGTGQMLALWNGGCTEATADNQYNAGYDLDNTAIACRLMFRKVF